MITHALGNIALAPAIPPVASPAARVVYLDLFRALAILMIVCLHAGNAFLHRAIGVWTFNAAVASAVNDILFHSATIYFSIISGMLYAHLFSGRPYLPFIRARFVNIGTPYIVITGVLTSLLWAAAWWRTGAAPDSAVLGREFLTNLLTGDAWNTLWYIPVILGLYALSPVLFALVQRHGLRWAAVVLILLPLLFARTGTVLTPSIFVHFMGAYVFGLMLGVAVDRSLDSVARLLPWVWYGAIASTAGLAALYASELDAVGPVSVRESLFYVQRITTACLLLLTLRNWSARVSPVRDAVLGWVAAASFGIYFVHGPLLRPVARWVGAIVPDGQTWWALLAGILLTFVGGLALSALLVQVARRALGRGARYLLGA